MKKYLFVLLLSVVVIYACNQLKKNNSKETTAIDNQFCANNQNPDELCPDFPSEVSKIITVGYTSSLDSAIQTHFDVFSWQTFVALNWPADAQGKPTGKFTDHPEAERVWEHYHTPEEVFNSGENSPLMLSLNQAKTEHLKFFNRMSKSPHRLDSIGGLTQADGYPLIDRNLNFAVFEVKINPDEEAYIKQNHLTSADSIRAFAQRHDSIDFPSSQAPSTIGAMEIKTSWRILDTSKGDIPSRFYTRDALIYIPAEHSASGKAFQVKAKVGLVGMHIIRKTGKFQKMVWSTFEHVDNVPENVQDAQMNQNPAIPWSFYNPKVLNMPINQPPVLKPGDKTYKWDTVAPYAKAYATSVPGEMKGQLFGTQVQRLFPIYYVTELINRLWQNKLKGTVWANYKLVGSQWVFGFGDGGTDHNAPEAPFYLGNSTMETFLTPTTSSCISCHAFAGVKYPDGKFIKSDFSFAFLRFSKSK